MCVRSRSPVLVAMLASFGLFGCNDTRDLAPASPTSPWRIQPGLTVQRQPADDGNAAPGAARRFTLPRDPGLPLREEPAAIDPGHPYSLEELIDIAQSRSKETRVAWEQARQAAIGVGLARAAYLPELTASALGGYQHTALPLPTRLARKGYITSNQEEIFPELALRYLLLDFGGRAAQVEVAKQTSFAANVGFTAAHQRLIFDVSRAYYMLDGVAAQLKAAERARVNAGALLQAASSLLGRGAGTVTNVALARRGVAQADFDIASATTAQHDALYALLAAIGLPPTAKLKVKNSSDRPLPGITGRTVEDMMQDALRQRPDLLAGLAQLRASDAGIALARSQYLPKVSVSANVQGNIGQVSTEGEKYQGIIQPQAGILLRFDWPLYVGSANLDAEYLARSKRAEAEERLRLTNDQALRQVALAYDQLETGLVQFSSAAALQSAAQTAFDAASDAYAHGVGTITDALNAQTALASARASVARAHSQSLVNAAALAFATGDLTSREALGRPSER